MGSTWEFTDPESGIVGEFDSPDDNPPDQTFLDSWFSAEKAGQSQGGAPQMIPPPGHVPAEVGDLPADTYGLWDRTKDFAAGLEKVDPLQMWSLGTVTTPQAVSAARGFGTSLMQRPVETIKEAAQGIEALPPVSLLNVAGQGYRGTNRNRPAVW